MHDGAKTMPKLDILGVIIQSRFKSRLFALHVFFAFSGSKFLINLRQQFRLRNIFFVYVKFFVYKVEFISVHLCLKLLFRKCVTYVVGCFY